MPQRAIFDIAQFKALDSEVETEGRFEAIVSVFGNEDHQGDRVMEGAFAKSLAQWQASGHPIPIIWSHQWGNPEAHIGSAEPADVVEVPGKGLKVTGSIDLDDRFSAKVFKLMKQGRVKEFSFGFAVQKQRRGKDGVNELVELDLFEVGPTLKGVNPSTELLSIKSQLEDAATDPEPVGEPGFKSGRSISAKTESRIREATDVISGGVASLLEILASQGGADEGTAAGDADEVKAKADEPKVVTDSGILELRALIMNVKE